MRRALALAAVLLLAACSKHADKTTLPKDFALRSTAVTFPDDSAEAFPGPGAEAINNDCRACHSPSMVQLQPPLKHDDWAKEVDKMRTVFKAPVPAEDVPAIVAYLDAMSAKQAR